MGIEGNVDKVMRYSDLGELFSYVQKYPSQKITKAVYRENDEIHLPRFDVEVSFHYDKCSRKALDEISGLMQLINQSNSQPQAYPSKLNNSSELPDINQVSHKLSIRGRHTLRRLNITSTEELLKHTNQDILGIRNVGLSTLNEMLCVLSSYGLSLRKS